VFEQDETTLADYMQALRLDARRRDFQSQEHAARSITDIALSWGNNSPAHLSRETWLSQQPRKAA
jgi:AraC-like DNA-binding protein